MKPTPTGWPRISSSVFYDDPHAAIDFLCRAFGFEVRLLVEGEGGAVEHSELTFGDDGLIMVGQTGRHGDDVIPCVSPQGTGGRTTQALCLYVDDVDGLVAHAVEQGATVAQAARTTDYGEEYWTDRSARLVDPEGHQWWFVQRIAG